MNPQDPNVIEEPTPQNSGAVEPILESILENQAQNGEATNQLLETSVEQNGEANELLEAGVRMQAETHEAVKEGGEKVAKAIEQLKPAMDAAAFIANFMAAIKGDKGDKGDTPVKGTDYYTAEEIAQIAEEVESRIRVPEDGHTPEKGEDYYTEDDIAEIVERVQSKIRIPEDGKDGENGKDAEPVDYDKIVRSVLPMLPKGRDGKPGKDGTQITTEQIIALIKDKLSYNDLADLPTIFKGMAGAGYLKDLTDVAITVEPTDGQVLKWSSAIKKWVPGTDNDSGGGAVPTYVDNETPGGTINGSNTAFTLAHAPSPAASLQLILNGQYLTQGVDYTLSGDDITMASAPDAAFASLPFKAFYRY